MTATTTPPTPPRPRRGVGRTLIRGVGELLITLGVVVLLFVVYEVYVTDLFGERKQAAATTQVDRVWAQSQETATVTASAAPQLATDPQQRVPRYDTVLGEGFAKLRIPALGADYVFTVVEGTDPDDLYIGPGHYSQTQLPGEQGNFAVAGHRVSKGSPFNDLGLLRSCDAIVVETQDDWFVYRVLPMAEEEAGWAAQTRPHCSGVSVQTGTYAGVYGREITVPSDYAQVLPVPTVLSTTVPPDAQRLITLTTCHPQFSDAERMIIHGVLVASYAKAPGYLPPELTET
ncbi:class E sortase [Nakamurella sp.]|uniref:class E sortase n=1 Tax=Nakamurella sp. TaxID=1869182 RepID=UPI003B3AA6E7